MDDTVTGLWTNIRVPFEELDPWLFEPRSYPHHDISVVTQQRYRDLDVFDHQFDSTEDKNCNDRTEDKKHRTVVT